MAYIATTEVATSIGLRLKFTQRVFGNAEEGRSDGNTEYKCTERNTSNILTSTDEARRRGDSQGATATATATDTWKRAVAWAKWQIYT